MAAMRGSPFLGVIMLDLDPIKVMASALASSVCGRCRFISSPSKSALNGPQQHSLNLNVRCGITWNNEHSFVEAIGTSFFYSFPLIMGIFYINIMFLSKRWQLCMQNTTEIPYVCTESKISVLKAYLLLYFSQCKQKEFCLLPRVSGPIYGFYCSHKKSSE